MTVTDASAITTLLASMRRSGAEPENVEVKSGAGGFPRSVRETVVAFANGQGGTILIGVDESDGFAVLSIPDLPTYRDQVAQLTRDQITPALHVTTDIVALEDGHVLVVEVPPARSDHKPVYVTSHGMTTGAYLRVGDSERRMTEAEIGLMYAARVQPRYDLEPVEGTSLNDLDSRAVGRMLERVQAGSVALAETSDLVALHRLNVLTAADEQAPVTLAGLLTFSEFPQQQFPQLMMSFVAYPAERGTETRFVDNVTVRGNIPELIAGALLAVRRNLSTRAVMDGDGRRDELEYPADAIREALANAVLHRDYHPILRGTQVQVELHPDRLAIRSPGGLYGGLAVDDLGKPGASTSRNLVLASLLADTYLPRSDRLVAENRASGIPAMFELADAQGVARPEFRSTITSFVVTMRRPAQRRRVTKPARAGRTGRIRVVAALRAVDSTTASDLERATGLSRPAVQRHLNTLIANRDVAADGPARSPRRSYRWVGDTDTGGDTS